VEKGKGGWERKTEKKREKALNELDRCMRVVKASEAALTRTDDGVTPIIAT
jgi:hypothetical protein